MKLLVPDSVTDPIEAGEGVEVVTYDRHLPIPEEHTDAEGLVVWDVPTALIADAAVRLRKLEWVQALLAGPDPVLAAGFRPNVRICSGVGLHSPTVAEHALALTLVLVRELPAVAAAQRSKRWAREFGGAQPLHPEGSVTTLLGAKVTIWGFGSIGQTLAPILTALGAEVTGVAREAGQRAGYRVVADVDEMLPTTDVLIMILPTTAGTALDARRLALLPPSAYVVNVGRGNAIDPDALVHALESEQLSGAALDVAPKEPLPAESRLWDCPHLFLTPHMAGGRPVNAPALIRENLAHLAAGEPLRNEVAR